MRYSRGSTLQSGGMMRTSVLHGRAARALPVILVLLFAGLWAAALANGDGSRAVTGEVTTSEAVAAIAQADPSAVAAPAPARSEQGPLQPAFVADGEQFEST